MELPGLVYVLTPVRISSAVLAFRSPAQAGQVDSTSLKNAGDTGESSDTFSIDARG